MASVISIAPGINIAPESFQLWRKSRSRFAKNAINHTGKK